MKRLGFAVFALALACSGCGGSSSNSDGAGVAAVTNRPEISEKQFRKLLRSDDRTLVQMAMDGQLGNCRLVQASGAGCVYGFSSSPAYSILLVDQQSPFVGASGQSQAYCQEQAGTGLREALQEGDCFTRHVPYEQFSESALARKALMGELGNCKLEKVSDDGCASGRSHMPLYRISFANKGTAFRGTYSGQESRYCFDRAGTDLKTALSSGLCF